jgi:hypothetical protein
LHEIRFFSWLIDFGYLFLFVEGLSIILTAYIRDVGMKELHEYFGMEKVFTGKDEHSKGRQ